MCILLITGYSFVFAWTTLNPTDADWGKTLTSTLMKAVMNNINELSGKFWTLTAGQQCTSDGTKIDCTTPTPVTWLGIGQTRRDLTSSRAMGTVYTNTGAKSIEVSYVSTSTTTYSYAKLIVNGVDVRGSYTSILGWYTNAYAIIPPGATYSASTQYNSTLFYWAELR